MENPAVGTAPLPPVAVAILMGVSGVGKTTVGRAAAQRLGWAFFDADDYHSETHVERMRRGIPLDDADRRAWLEALADRIRRSLDEGLPAIVTCSALKERYRRVLLHGNAGAIVVYLRAERNVVASRLEARHDHYFGVGLLDSQYAALEEPQGAITIDAGQPLGRVVDTVAAALARTASSVPRVSLP